jgi:hypothetical protein
LTNTGTQGAIHEGGASEASLAWIWFASDDGAAGDALNKSVNIAAKRAGLAGRLGHTPSLAWHG